MAKGKIQQDTQDAEEEITQVTSNHPEVEEKEPEEKGSLEKKFKEMEDKYLRLYADLDNFRKRAAKEREELALHTGEKLLKELLEVKDHLELALTHAQESTSDIKTLKEGVQITLKQLEKFLEKSGVQSIEALGKPFDPTFHEAIHQEETEKHPAGTVCHEYQRGYLFHGRLLRPARVTVSAAKQDKK